MGYFVATLLVCVESVVQTFSLKYCLTSKFVDRDKQDRQYTLFLFLLFSFFCAKVCVYKESQLFALYYVFSKIFHIEYLKNT